MAPIDPEVAELLIDAVDPHVHTDPDAFDRHDTDATLARKARARDMAAIVIKNHHFETGARAQLVTEETGFRVLGGITLNTWVGGLNPIAVDGAAELGVDVVWMPTITARNHLQGGGSVPHLDEGTDDEATGEGLTVLDDAGELTDDARSVLDRIAANDLVLALGHLHPEEAFPLTRAALDRGVREVICHHPHAGFLRYDHEQLQRMVDLGARIELHYGSTTGMMGEPVAIDDLVATARAVGVERVMLATDGGATINAPPMEQLEAFLADLLGAGLSKAEIRTMVRDIPKAVYRLP